MRRQSLAVAGAFDDDLIAGVGQPVQRAVAEDGVSEETEPLIHGAVAGDDKAGSPVPVEDELVQIGGLRRGEPVQPEVIEDESNCSELVG